MIGETHHDHQLMTLIYKILLVPEKWQVLDKDGKIIKSGTRQRKLVDEFAQDKRAIYNSTRGITVEDLQQYIGKYLI